MPWPCSRWQGAAQEGWEGKKQEAAETIRLYDKRIKVYYGLMELIAAVVQEGNVGPRQLVKFAGNQRERLPLRSGDSHLSEGGPQ